jgi:hypothetical protein
LEFCLEISHLFVENCNGRIGLYGDVDLGFRVNLIVGYRFGLVLVDAE